MHRNNTTFGWPQRHTVTQPAHASDDEAVTTDDVTPDGMVSESDGPSRLMVGTDHIGVYARFFDTVKLENVEIGLRESAKSDIDIAKGEADQFVLGLDHVPIGPWEQLPKSGTSEGPWIRDFRLR